MRPASRPRLARIVRLAALAALLAAPSTAAPTARFVVAVAAAWSGDGGRTSLTLTLSGPVSASAFVLDRPERAVVDLPEVNCQLGRADDRGAGRGNLVAAVRCGEFAPGRARLVIDLSGPATVSQPVVAAGPIAGTWLLSVDLARADREGFRRAVAAGLADNLAATTGSLPSGRARQDDRPIVALDAGHGGEDAGARSQNGLYEKDLTLVFTRELRDRLVRSGRYRVVLTREKDVFVALGERVRLAREAGAALFLSIHADSISRPSIRGATIYTGAERASDPDAAKLAERENEVDAAAGARPGDGEEVAGILQDLTQRETRDFSRRLAGHLYERLAPVTRFTSEPHREAGFRVLRASDMPAALLELGYLSNPRDTELMFSEPWRRRSAEAVSGAIERFFATGAEAGAAGVQASAAVSP